MKKTPSTLPDKAPVVGIPISKTSYDEVLASIENRPTDGPTVIAVCNVHSVMSARRDPALNEAIGGAAIATPDGVPLVWALRWTVRPDQDRVYGPELMRRGLLDPNGYGWRHFLYGSSEETIEALTSSIEQFAPSASVVGAISPPFRPLTKEEEAAHIDQIRSSNADVVWVGLGMPKQELWMHEHRNDLHGVAIVGVGAAFDFLAGTVKQAPSWMQRAGLEWVYRLIQEPRRLWKRYLWNNPAFVLLLVHQLVATRLSGRRRSARSTS